MENRVKQTIQKFNLIENNEKIVIGVSGGPDSLALLHILYNLGYDICVAHINHGLRDSADADEKFVKDFCAEREIPCFVKRIQLKEILKNDLKGMSTEEAGREERYQFFKEVLVENHCHKIATAHNSNDNVETVLMNMMRGSGLSGLKGIEPQRENIIRPLIEISRKEIEEYCEKNKLQPRKDETNDETIYTRNKVRLELIPYLEKNINSNIMQNITRMSEIIREEEKFISNQVDEKYAKILKNEENGLIELSLKSFNNLDVVLKRRIILKSIIKVNGNAKDIEKVHVDDIVKLCKNNIGGKYLTPKKYIKVSVLKGIIKFEKL